MQAGRTIAVDPRVIPLGSKVRMNGREYVAEDTGGAIKASMSEEGFRDYLKGNVMKYIWRYEHKGRVIEDIEKALWYLNRLKDELYEQD